VTEGPLTRFARALLLAAATVGLLALVAVAADGYRLGGARTARASPYAVDTILTIGIAVYIVGAVAVIIAMFWSGITMRRYERLRSRRDRTMQSLILILGAALLISLAAARFHWVHPHARAKPPASANAVPDGDKKTSRQTSTHHAHVRLAPLLVIIGAAGIAFAAFMIAERRRKRRLPPDGRPPELLSDVLDQTLDDLRKESDPRRAVIAAYARMERSLAAHGLPRRGSEAPHEYLARVLGELSAGRLPASRLTASFERARFSPHEIDAGMKADAIDAIESLQADLAAAEAEAAA
jgi:Domain of unknown function (DUF4129)